MSNLPPYTPTTSSVLNLAALRNTTAVVGTTYVQGNSANNDGGQGTFVYISTDTTSPDNGGTIITPNLLPGRWHRQYTGPVNVKWFGAKGNGSTNDTAAIQAATTWVISQGGGEVYYPAGTYLVTNSINSTVASTPHPVWHIGEGRYLSVILHQFANVNPYPVIDACGNTNGGLRDLSIVPSGISYATCGYLAAKFTTGGTSGNGQMIERCLIQAGNVTNDSAVVFYNANLSRIVDSIVLGGGQAITAGTVIAGNVNSRYVTLSSQVDWTQGYITRSEFSSTNGPAISYTGGSMLTINDSYATLTGAGTYGKIMEVTGTSGNGLLIRGLRMDNQSSASVYGIYFTGASAFGDIEAVMALNANDICIGSGVSGTISNYRFATTSNSVLLGLNAAITNTQFEGYTTAIGNSNAVAASSGLEFIGYNAANVTSVFGTISGLKITGTGEVKTSMNQEFFAPGLPSVVGRGRMVVAASQITTNAYVANSGTQTIFSDTVHLALLNNWQSGAIPASYIDYEMGMNVNAFGPSGTMAVKLTQGSNSVVLLSFTPPTTNSFVKIKIKLLASGNPASITAGITEVVWGNSGNQYAQANVASAGITPALGDATLTITANSIANVASTTCYVTCEV